MKLQIRIIGFVVRKEGGFLLALNMILARNGKVKSEVRKGDWKFKLLKWLGRRFGFLGVGWEMNHNEVIMKMYFSNPEELDEPIYI